MIYDHAVPYLLHPEYDEDGQLFLWNSWSIEEFYEPKPEGWKRDPTTDFYGEKLRTCGMLMTVSHQMRLEIGPSFYNHIGFMTEELFGPKCTRFFESLTPFTKSLLRDLIIRLDPYEVIGARRPKPEERLASIGPLVQLISSFPKLRRLRIEFGGISYHPSTHVVRDVWYYGMSKYRTFWKWRNFYPPQGLLTCVATLSDFDAETLQLIRSVAAACPQLKHACYGSDSPLFQNHVEFAVSPAAIDWFTPEESIDFDPIAGYAAIETKHAQIANLRDYFERMGLLRGRDTGTGFMNSRYLCKLICRIMRDENYYYFEFWKDEEGNVKEAKDMSEEEIARFKRLGKGTACVSRLRKHLLERAKKNFIECNW